MRSPIIVPAIQKRLYNYLGGVMKSHNGNLIEIGGMPDHVHLLIELKRLDSFTNMIRDLKSGSSRWVNTTFPNLNKFVWQEGYGSFSVSYSSVEHVQKYIRNQEEHHKNMTFDQEYINILKHHQVEFNEKYVLG